VWKKDLGFNPANSSCASKRRIRDAIQRLHSRNYSMWKGRNNALHGTSENEPLSIYTLELSAIRHYHSRPHLLAAGDRHYCARSLISILCSSPSIRRCWLLRVRQAQAAYIKDGSQQTQMTMCFQGQNQCSLPLELQPDIPIINATVIPQPKVTQSWRQQQQLPQSCITTQSLITRFFPSARPLDRPSYSLPFLLTPHALN
jgi:hypothetical protein